MELACFFCDKLYIKRHFSEPLLLHKITPTASMPRLPPGCKAIGGMAGHVTLHEEGYPLVSEWKQYDLGRACYAAVSFMGSYIGRLAEHGAGRNKIVVTLGAIHWCKTNNYVRLRWEHARLTSSLCHPPRKLSMLTHNARPTLYICSGDGWHCHKYPTLIDAAGRYSITTVRPDWPQYTSKGSSY